MSDFLTLKAAPEIVFIPHEEATLCTQIIETIKIAFRPICGGNPSTAPVHA